MNLSKRESEIMKLIAEGRSNDFIAKSLYRSKDTIRSFLKKLYIKLNIDGNKYDKRLKLALLGQDLKENQDGKKVI